MLRQRKAAWLIALPVATASWLAAHCLAYVLVPQDGAEHTHHHAEAGHAYFGSTPVLIAAGVTLLAAGLVLCVDEGLRGRPRQSRPPAGLFALLPPLGFVVQEHVEHLIVAGSLPHDLATEPTFLVGLALQLPFAVGALLATHALYSLGYGLGRLLACRLEVRRLATRSPLSVLQLRAPFLVVASVLAAGHGPRAPPAGACP